MPGRRPRGTALGAVAATCALVACGGGTTPAPGREEPSQPVPVTLIVEQEITGEVLGAPLRSPFGLAISSDNSIYCVDRGNSRIIKFRQDLIPVREAGGEGSAEGLLLRPGFITVDNNLNIFVADEGNQRICRFNSDLLYVDAIEFYDADDPLKFGEPGGIAVNAHGEMWVADRQRDRIAIFTAMGAFDRFIGEFGSRGGQVKSPEAIRLDGAGRFHVCDAGNGRIVAYDQYGNDLGALANSAFDYPMSTIPLETTSWLIDGAGGRVILCDDEGGILLSAGPSLLGSDRPLREPSDLVLLPDDRLLIADTGNNRLLVCRPLGGTP